MKDFFYQICLLLIVTLILVMPSFSEIEQQNEQTDANVPLNAKTDAENDFNGAPWFVAGSVPILATIAGTIVGLMIGTSHDAGNDSFVCAPSGAQVIGTCLGGHVLALVPCLAVGISINQFQPGSIPAERFIGKTPEYIEVYTATYKRETRRLRLEFVIIGGAITGCGRRRRIAFAIKYVIQQK